MRRILIAMTLGALCFLAIPALALATSGGVSPTPVHHHHHHHGTGSGGIGVPAVSNPKITTQPTQHGCWITMRPSRTNEQAVFELRLAVTERRHGAWHTVRKSSANAVEAPHKSPRLALRLSLDQVGAMMHHRFLARARYRRTTANTVQVFHANRQLDFNDCLLGQD